MADRKPILRARTVRIDEQITVTRGIIAKCLDVLKEPLPDTFLGRKTYEPFPPAEEQQIEGWLNSMELQPPK